MPDREVAARDLSIIVLDDDPTGTQTVHGVPVITEWTVDAIQSEFRRKTPVFFILTNSRSLPEEEAEALAACIGRNIREAADACGREFRIISRSDSTLRGHYPAEILPLEASLFKVRPIHVLIPAFIEAGRVTVEGVHYVREGDALIPVAHTPFASDHAFGYRHSRLADWVMEKTGGRIGEWDIRHIPLACTRQGGVEGILSELSALQGESVITVDACTYSDLDTISRAFRLAEDRGMVFLYRTAASFVGSYAGINPGKSWDFRGLAGNSQAGGLLVVGSYVPLTTQQLACLRAETPVEAIELDVDPSMGESAAESQVKRITHRVTDLIGKGLDVVVYTARNLVRMGNPAVDLEFGRRVSGRLVDIVSSLPAQPGFLIAKGGITSSDIATKALGVRRAWILGQLLPGVPVWQLGPEAKFPGMLYFIFPGNVGNASSLTEAYWKVKGRVP